MPRVLLIRHAQASFGAADYDRLSERGLAQSRHLAAWLVVHEDTLHLGALASGDLRRHAQTLAAIQEAFAGLGRHLPPVRIDPDWNEFAHESVVRAYLNLHPEAAQAAKGSHDPRTVKVLLTAALLAWARGELDADVPESWAAFGARVQRARERLLEHAVPGATTLVLSSGGVIARCAQVALGTDDARAVGLNLTLRNTGISEFFADQHGWNLHTWNGLPQFSEPGARAWMTYY